MKRTVKKQFWFSREEAQELQKKSKRACLSEAALIRFLLRGFEPKEKPDERFYDAMRELSAIGNNINQLSAKANSLNFIDAPMIAKEAEGFIYIVSSLGVTGVRSEIKTDLDSIVKVIRENTDVPCAIGFGISTPEQAKKMADISDGAIVGSAIIKLLEKHGKEAPDYIGEYVRSMKNAIR